MTDKDFESYLKRFAQLLRLGSRQRQEISAELRDHLEQRLEELLRLGQSRAEATRIAVEELGDAEGLAANFISINKRKRQRWAMRFATFSIAGCFVVALLIFSLWPDQGRLPLTGHSTAQEITVSRTSPSDNSVEARNKRTREVLENTIVDLNIDEINFGELLNQWREEYQIEFYLDDSSELKAETPVTFRLRQVRLSMALELLMGRYNSQLITRDGIILIASVDKMAEFGLEIRVLNCRDLISEETRALDHGSDPIATPDQDPAVADPGPSLPKRLAKEDQLVTMIKTVVAPSTWLEEGPSIVVYDGLLVANCTATVHQEIEKLLAQLRKIDQQSPLDSFTPK